MVTSRNSHNPSVVIVIPVHNALTYLQETLQCLSDSTITSTQYEVVIVNDGSNTETSDYLKNISKTNTHIHLLVNPVQQLFTRTINRGIRYAWKKFKPEFIITMNSDCKLQRGWDIDLLDLMQDPNIGLVGYRDFTPEGLEARYEEMTEPQYVTGHLCIHRTEILKIAGVYCETDLTGTHFPEFSPYKGLAHIGSDRLLSYRVHQLGYKTVYSNFPGVIHEAGKSWHHDLGWLQTFNLTPLWEPNDWL